MAKILSTFTWKYSNSFVRLNSETYNHYIQEKQRYDGSAQNMALLWTKHGPNMVPLIHCMVLLE